MVAVARPRRHPAPWLFAIVGCAVAATIFASFGPPGLLAPQTVCELGARVGTFTIWAPTMMANNPDEGSAVMQATIGPNYTFTSGSLTVGALPSSPLASGGGVGENAPKTGIFASYADWNFTFYRATNVSRIGVVSDRCTQPYVATFSPIGGFCHSDFSIIPLADNSTDAMEPHVWNGTTGLNSTYNRSCPVGTPGAQVWFDTQLNLVGAGLETPYRWSLCNASANQTIDLLTVARIPVVVTVPYEDGSISTAGFLTWEGSGDTFIPTVQYTLPGGWVWILGPVGPVSWAVDPMNAPIPGLLAFERLAC